MKKMKKFKAIEERVSALVSGDIVQIAKAFGFCVVIADLDGTCGGFMIVNNRRRKILGIKVKRLIVLDRRLSHDNSRLLVARALVQYDYSGRKTPFTYVFKGVDLI